MDVQKPTLPSDGLSGDMSIWPDSAVASYWRPNTYDARIKSELISVDLHESIAPGIDMTLRSMFTLDAAEAFATEILNLVIKVRGGGRN